VAVTYQQDELKFLERMDYLKPRFDTSLLAYLNFAIAEEELKMKVTGLRCMYAPMYI
jgi:hypothetical protein